MSLMPVYLGLNGMSIALTEFYYKHLLEPNICYRLISLCVSDTLAIDNGLWLASHVSTFINLRHLSLVDIKRSSFELILNAFSPNNSIAIFSVRFSTYYRAAYTFEGVSEGAYHERVFHLFPQLRACHLCFWRYMNYSLETQLVLSPRKAFLPIQTNLLKLQSIVLRECSIGFLSHLLEHIPQLQELRFEPSTSWLPDTPPLMHGINE